MAYGRIDDNGRLVRYGSKVKIDGVWVDIKSADAASWRSENGVKEIDDDGGASCVCEDCEVPVATGWDGTGDKIVRVYTATAVENAKAADISRAVQDISVSGMTGDQKDALLQKIVRCLGSAAVAVLAAFMCLGATSRSGSLTSDDEVVTAESDPVALAEMTNYVDSVTGEVYNAACTYADVRANEEGVLGRDTAIEVATNYTNAALADIPKPAYSWVRPDAWAIDVEIDKSEQIGAVTVVGEETDAAGRVWSNETYIATFGMAAKCSPMVLDESSMYTPEIETWAALPPGGTIDSSGHFVAETSGLYRVSATATDGTTHYADIAISAERTVTNANVRTYMADAVGGLRKSLNDDGLADLMAASFVSSNRYGTTWYTVYNIEPPRWSEPGGWVFHPFAIAPRILATCAHGIWEGREGLYESHTFSNAVGTTYTLRCNLHWVILKDWALANDFTAAEAATVDDLAVNFATYVPRGTGDTDTGIDSSILPSFFTPESFERYLQSDAVGVIGWHQGQDHAQPFPISFAQQNFQNWGPPSRWSAVLRRDIYARLVAMDFINYPLHGGDSGCPVFLRSSTLGDIVVAHHTSVMACRADYITGFKIIKAFAAACGQTLKEVE